MGEVGDYYRVGSTSGLVKEDQVGDILGEAGGGKGADDGVPSVQAVGVGEYEAELLSITVSV